MPRSTAKFIDYDLRPAKQSERRILIDLLRAAGDCLPIGQYRYVGMGGNRFYDFLMIYKYLGISEMISIEHDPIMFERAKFNSPYKFIDIRNQSIADFIDADRFDKPTIAWLDYDGGISASVIADINSFAPKCRVGDFCFITTYGGPPRSIAKANAEARLAWVKEAFGDVGGRVLMDDVQNSTFTTAVYKILTTAFQSAFSARRDAEFVPLLMVNYSDSVDMVTVGGAFLTHGQATGLRDRLMLELPFLCDVENLYEISSFHLTERERALFDRAATGRIRSTECNALARLGFDVADIAAYKVLLRYLPRYVETIV